MAIEFVLMISLAMVILVVLIGVLFYLTINYSEERNINRLKDLGYSLQSELILAAQVEPGYERTITIPDKVGSASYSLSQTLNDLVIRYKKTDLLFSIPQVSGSLNKGNNVIRRCDDVIKINSIC